MKVVIVDDSSEDRKQACQYIGKYFDDVMTLDPQDITFKFYHDYDLYFLDLEMQPSGQEIARKIKQVHPQAIFIFMTHHQSYIFKTQIFNPFYFIRKTHFEEDLQIAMNMFDIENGHFLTILSHKQKVIINMNDIHYIEVYGGKITIHTQERSISYWGTFKELLPKLPERKFMRIHKSYIINKNHIQGMRRTELIMMGKYLPVSRKYIKEVRDYFNRIVS